MIIQQIARRWPENYAREAAIEKISFDNTLLY